MNRHWQRFLAICLIALLVVTWLQPAVAGFSFGGFQIPTSPSDLINIGKDSGQKAAYAEIGKALGLKAPVHLDSHHAFPQSEEPRDFKPVQLRLEDISDLNAKLPPGDYVMNIIAYCTNYSIHRPGKGVPYTIAPAEGTKIKAIANLTLRGELAHMDRGTLQNISSTIQAGLPLSQWREEYRTVAHQLIPDFEGDLRGDLLDEYQGEYERVRATIPVVHLPGFDEGVAKLPLGKEILTIKKARSILTDRSISAQEVGDRLYQATGDGSPQTLTPSDPKASPWVKVRDNVVARVSVINGRAGDGSSGINRLEFRILEDKAGSKELGKLAQQLKPQPPAVNPGGRPAEILKFPIRPVTIGAGARGITTIARILYGAAAIGTGIGVGVEIVVGSLIIYGVEYAVQALTVAPAIEKEKEKEKCANVVRAGVALPKNIQAGVREHKGMPGLIGFSVQSAPEKTIEELARAGEFPNLQISVTTDCMLKRIGLSLMKSPGTGYHKTVVTPMPLTNEQAATISAVFTTMPNPAPVKR